MTIPTQGDAPRPLAVPLPFAGLGHDFASVRQRAQNLRLIGVVRGDSRSSRELSGEPFEHAVSGFMLLLMQGREIRGR